MFSTVSNNNQQQTVKDGYGPIELVRRLCLPSQISVNMTPSAMQHPDWSRIITYAIRHGLAPLLYHAVGKFIQNFSNIRMIQGKVSEPSLPWGIDPQRFQMLSDAYLSTLKRNSQVQSVLKELDSALAHHNIPCILWKGAAFINNLYADIGLRPMADIDVLVSKQHKEAMEAILRRLGFVPRSAYPLTWDRREIVIDLHLDVVHADRISSR